ncbi:uncharacterized protein MONBRDRAFT_33664 [Monosiga brevicollis MX1]|uniref:alpha-1,2-Mannosidase n=1 Tax=Monosiga brevicollis TaxID=81824 RepID=A9V6F6_MONBE|nr:uncharacterized protein MONBRDRAFT_33664 [Monosiga brevicollis MX1]EDQ86875.1 predicted protein [Monosiga brevicollis MX1]|eukprot:XP_001748420.1 hypothetical protein [Monosiga brevicollis MX1]
MVGMGGVHRVVGLVLGLVGWLGQPWSWAGASSVGDDLWYPTRVRNLTQYRLQRREEVRQMFYHGFDNYMEHAFPHDELQPLSCTGRDTWGPYSLTLIDSLDTLHVLGNASAFEAGLRVTIRDLNFDIDKNVSVFETTIRMLGGLLSAHLVAADLKAQDQLQGPYHQELLDLATDLGDRLLPAFDTPTGRWTLLDAGIGSNQDSFYEYLVKGYIMLGDEEYLHMLEPLYAATATKMKVNDWYFDANMKSGAKSLPWFTALSAFWPGLQALYGDVAAAHRTLLNFQDVWRLFGFVPEAYNLNTGEFPFDLKAYFLRPELAESLMYTYRATKSHALGDRMESFFLSETLKYLFLLFDEDNFIHRGGHVFNTEAHYFPILGQGIAQPPAEPTAALLQDPEAKLKAAQKTQAGLAEPTVPEMPSANRIKVTGSDEEAEALLSKIKAQVAEAKAAGEKPDVRDLLQEAVKAGIIAMKEDKPTSPADAAPAAPADTLTRLERLQTLVDACFKHEADYWTYEVCFGRFARQYHQEKGTIQIEYSLGVRHVAEAVRAAETLDQVQTVMDGVDVRGYVEQANTPLVLRHVFEHGDTCVPGLSRRATVHYQCDPSLRDLPKQFTMSVSELEQCLYNVSISSGLLCPSGLTPPAELMDSSEHTETNLS